MLRLFNKFLPIVVGVLTAAIFAACSDDSILDNASDPITDPYGCTVNSPVECDFGIYTAVCHLLDEKIKGYYVLAADSIQRISTKELKPFASCPILIDKKYGHLLPETESSKIIIKYWYYGIKSTTIDGKEYQLVELIDDNAIIPVSRTNPDQLCGTPPFSDYPTPDKLRFSRSAYDPVTIQIYYHAVRLTNGSGITNKETKAIEILNQLDRYYSGTGISFKIIGSDFLDVVNNWNDIYINYASFLHQYNPHENAIDIYELSGNNPSDTSLGNAYAIVSSYMVVANSSKRTDETVGSSRNGTLSWIMAYTPWNLCI